MFRLTNSLRSCGALSIGACAIRQTRCEEELDNDVKDEFTESISSGGIKAPGQYESWDSELKRLISVQTFKGAKVDITKPMSANFMIRHSLQLGDSPNPEAEEHYSLMAQVFNDYLVAVSTLDQYGSLENHFIAPALPFDKNASTKLITYFGPQGDMFWHDVDYNGDTYNTQFRWGSNVMGWSGKMAQLSYAQSITPKLTLAAQVSLQNNFTTPTSETAIRYDRMEDTTFLGYKSHLQPCGAGEPGMMEISLGYHRKVVKDRVNLGASLQLIPQAMHAASTFGAEFQLHQSTVSTMFCPSAGKIGTTVQTRLNPNMNMSFSLEGMFNQQNQQTGKMSDSFRFGCGLALG